jgi:hypothetical protein
MSSVLRHTAQAGPPKFLINISSAYNSIYSINLTTSNVAPLAGNPTWWSTIVTGNNVSTSGSVILRDMAKTVQIYNSTFKKVQIVSPNGLIGPSGTASNTDFGTGYIEMTWYDGQGNNYLTRSVWANIG